MICPSCKKELEDGAIFCKHCGSDVTPTGTIRCPSCGGLLERGVHFCKYCGISLVSSGSSSSKEGPCPFCQKNVPAGASFCRHCGKKISGTGVSLDPYETFTNTTPLDTEPHHPPVHPPAPPVPPPGPSGGGSLVSSFADHPDAGSSSSKKKSSPISTNSYLKPPSDLL